MITERLSIRSVVTTLQSCVMFMTVYKQEVWSIVTTVAGSQTTHCVPGFLHFKEEDNINLIILVPPLHYLIVKRHLAAVRVRARRVMCRMVRHPFSLRMDEVRKQ